METLLSSHLLSDLGMNEDDKGGLGRRSLDEQVEKERPSTNKRANEGHLTTFDEKHDPSTGVWGSLCAGAVNRCEELRRSGGCRASIEQHQRRGRGWQLLSFRHTTKPNPPVVFHQFPAVRYTRRSVSPPSSVGFVMCNLQTSSFGPPSVAQR